MVDENNREVLQQILELTDTACQASLDLLMQYTSGNLNVASRLLSDLAMAVSTIQSAQEPLIPQLEHAYTCEMLENIEDTLDDIERSIQEDRPERAAMKMEFQLFPFLRQLRESFYFWGMVYPDNAEMQRYYQEEFAEHYRNFYIQVGVPTRYTVSILVLAYNHLENTRECVESVLKNTDFEKLNAELVLVDHGSTDGTLEYFESIPFAKVIHLKNNCRAIGMVIGEKVCEGKFCAMLWNDTIVTPGWIELLLQCMNSDPKIISASAAIPRMANLQAIHVPDLPKDKFLEFARLNNHSDPSKWMDRSRICPQITIYNEENTNQVGLFDPLFYTLAFSDDDFSVRARRAGFRQILCEDVFCFHYGSLTASKLIQGEDKILEEGRKLFYQRYGFDAWDTGFCYDYSAIQLLTDHQSRDGMFNFLGIDCGMGDTPLQVRNELRRKGRTCKLYQISTQSDFIADLNAISDRFLKCTLNDLSRSIQTEFTGASFHGVFLALSLEKYEKYREIISEIWTRLCNNGVFICKCSNPFYVLTIRNFLQLQLQQDREILLDINSLYKFLDTLFSRVDILSECEKIQGLESFAKYHFRNAEDMQSVQQKLKTKIYYFRCIK